MIDNSAIVIASLGIVATAVGALSYIVKLLVVEVKKSIENSTKSQVAVAKALEKVSKNTDKNTQATKHADEYLRQRNGRDNEHHTAVLKALEVVPQTLRKIADDAAVKVEAVRTDLHDDDKKVTRKVVAK